MEGKTDEAIRSRLSGAYLRGADLRGADLRRRGPHRLGPRARRLCATGDAMTPDQIDLARRLVTHPRWRWVAPMVDRLEGESLEVIEALGLHEDTPHAEVLAHVRSLVAEHRAMRSRLEES